MAEHSSFRRILTSMQNTVQGRSTVPPGTSALQYQSSKMEGWLRKQGGIVKSWHQRWFTIKGDQLYYYASKDQSKPPLGVIFLPGNCVNTLPNVPNEPEKFLFEITPGGDRSRMTVTHETYPICASSDEERAVWVHAIKKVMYYDKGGAIFGTDLDEVMAYENLTSTRKVPQIVEMCVEFIVAEGMNVEGIFRLPGRSSVIKRLKEEFDAGQRPVFCVPEYDVHSVASLLKLYLREMPAPLIPVVFYEQVMKIVTRDFHQHPEAALDNLAKVMNEIPCNNYNLLRYLSQFLLEVSRMCEVNRMPIMNLATVFVQNNIIQPELNDAALLMGTANGRTQVAFLLITNCDRLFKMDYNKKGASVHVDNLVNLDVTETFKAETGNSSTRDPNSDLLAIDLCSDLPSPLAPGIISKRKQSIGSIGDDSVASLTEVHVDDIGDPMENVPDEAGDIAQSPNDSSLSPSQSSFTEVTEDIPSDMTTSWSCSSYDIGSYPSTPSSETQPPTRPPRPVPRSRSNQEVANNTLESPTMTSSSSTTPPAVPARPPLPPQAGDALRAVRQAARGPVRASLSSSSVSTESVDTIDSGHVDTEDELENDRLEALLAVRPDDLTHKQLLAHTEHLCEELRAQRARNHALQAAKATLKDRHQAQVLDLTKKMDSEKTATASAVKRVVDLQGKLHHVEMAHGNLV